MTLLTNELHGLWNLEVQCRIHKGSPMILILSRINPIPRIDNYFFKIHSHLSLGLPKSLFSVGVRVKSLKALLSSSILATRPAYLSLIDLIALTILGERCKLSKGLGQNNNMFHA